MDLQGMTDRELNDLIREAAAELQARAKVKRALERLQLRMIPQTA